MPKKPVEINYRSSKRTSTIEFRFLGEQKTEEVKQWLNEKGSEVKAKSASILDATQHALATGAAKVTEKAKHGLELAQEAAHTAHGLYSYCACFLLN